jgi:hypothetical protein
LPPIVYTPPPKPKKVESRPKSRGVQSNAAASDIDETEETGEAFASGKTARAAAPAPKDPFAPVDGTERRMPSPNGKLSDDMLKAMIEVQEKDGDPT